MSASGLAEATQVAPLPGAPRTAAGTIDRDRLVDLLRPCDVYESATDGPTYIVPHTGAVMFADATGCRLDHPDGRTQLLPDDPFAALDVVTSQLNLHPFRAQDSNVPAMTGALAGAFSYDLGRHIESLPSIARSDRPNTWMYLRLAEVVVAVDASGRNATAAARTSALSSAPAHQLVAEVTARIGAAASAAHASQTADPPSASPDAATVTSSLSAADHHAAVDHILDAIAAGEVFQVNLTQRLTANFDGDAHDLYRQLRRHSAAAFGAVLPQIGVASISPETFLALDGRQVVTRPIKGTRPRLPQPDLDAAMADDLATSVKDRAENVMVVDMERNDLGRVCEPGSVHVPALTDVEAHPTVWHLVSTVAGTLREDVGYAALLRATFPCGSITGAPKVAAMRLIETLEPVRRGWYCGAIGFLGAGTARLSVGIRTATLQPNGTVDYGAGGGIVADSDASLEAAEANDKAAAFLRAVGAADVDTPVASLQSHTGPETPTWKNRRA